METARTMTPRPMPDVPADPRERDEIRRAVRDYCRRQAFAPPLGLDEILFHAEALMLEERMEPAFRDFIAVLVNNEAWRDIVAATPFERRILLLPQCLRSSAGCPAESDALGLLCESCGRCAVGGIRDEAERLGYEVLVAEGTTAVSALLAGGVVDALIGVSCMEALEKSFRPLTAHAVPALAVPLLRNGCVDTAVDVDWILEVLRLRDGARSAAPLDMEAVRREVHGWFEPRQVAALLNLSGTETEAIAADWLARDGKRWRPALAVCVFRLLTESTGDTPAAVRKAASAVECFHKASLVHDDIEDEDETRYGAPTLHRLHGVAVAVNAGDLLIGEGYRLIAESGASAEAIRQMMAVAVEAHRALCLGQGEELLLRRAHAGVSARDVLEIYRRKTGPAFEVALQIGAICAGADASTRAVLSSFSNALGIAYQIRDDLQDRTPDARREPSLLTALADGERAEERMAGEWLGQYREEALRALRPLRHAGLKCFLHRVVAMILDPPAA